MKKFKYCLLALLCPYYILAQGLSVQGTILNEDQEPVAGATIHVKNTDIETFADDKGFFLLNQIHPSAVLLISAIGYHPVEQKAVADPAFTIILKRKVKELDELIVQAYGTTTRRLNTGNISRISAEEITSQPVSNPLATLSGRVPGLSITQTSGVAGSTFNVRIRGRSSLDLSISQNDPLFIIDGVPFEAGSKPANQLVSAANNPVSTNNSTPSGLSPFNTINPHDIESIEVLKDADATAIYGSRGANGVILITTKKGHAGKPRITISTHTGFSRAVNTMPMLNTSDYVNMRKEAFANDGIAMTATNAPDLLLWDTSRYTNFTDMLIGSTGHTNHLQVSIAGGEKHTRFTVSTGYHRETNVFPGSFADQRGTMHLNLSHLPALASWGMQLSALYTNEKNKLFRSDLTRYTNLPPHLQVYNDDQQLNWSQEGVNFSALGFLNPLAEQLRSYSANNQHLSANLMFNYTPFKGLLFKTNFGYNTFNNTEESLVPKSAIAPENGATASSYFGQAWNNNWIIEPQVELTTRLGKGTVKILTGATFQERSSKRYSGQGSGYTNDILLTALDAASAVSASNYTELYRYTALFGRINYDWQHKYLLNFSARRDGSSRFGPGKRFDEFGALGAAWIFTEEPWLKDKSILSFGKLRGSMGITGNDQIGDYRYLDLWTSTTNPYQGIPGLRPQSLYNPDYNWEKNRKMELALELGFWEDKFSMSLAHYRHLSTNQLINYRLPNQSGFTSVIKNMPAKISNTGWEIMLHMPEWVWGALSMQSTFNVSFPKNELLSFPGLETSSYSGLYIKGYPLSVIHRLNYLGIDPATGLYDFQDVNGDGMISASTDAIILGHLEPKYAGGFNHVLRYKGFQLDAFFEFRKQDGANYLANQAYNPAGFLYNQPELVLDRWQKPGDEAKVQRFGAQPSSPVFKASTLLRSSNGIYSDASFIRFKTLSLSYELPTVLIKRIGIDRSRIYVQGQNLATFTQYLGADPETQNSMQLPPLRTIVAGFQLTF